MNDELPDYAETLRLQHNAYATELREMLADVLRAASPAAPSGSGDSRRRDIADVACGDGFFSRLLAEIDDAHHVVGIDASEAYLSAARGAASPQLAQRLTFRQDDILAPETPAESFDVVFCVDSLESISDHAKLIRQLVRLCRPGGTVVVTETDDLHDLIGSWPPEVGNTLHRLEWEGLSEADREGYAFPRYAAGLFRAADLSELMIRSYTFDRSGPLDAPMRQWVAEHFRARLEAITGGSEQEREQLHRHLHPDGEEYFADSPHAFLTYLRFCIIGRKPR